MQTAPTRPLTDASFGPVIGFDSLHEDDGRAPARRCMCTSDSGEEEIPDHPGTTRLYIVGPLAQLGFDCM